MSNSEIISIISIVIPAIIGIVGLLLAYREYRGANKVKRSDFLTSLLNRMYDDSDIKSTMYSFQYNRFDYSSAFHGSKEEFATDKTLEFFSYICYLEDKRIISKEEFSFFGICISQALRNKDLIDYLFNLFHFEKKVRNSRNEKSAEEAFTYRYLLQYAKRIGLVDKTFYDSNSTLYPRYLNF